MLASTAGLGRAVAAALLGEGANVSISGRDDDRLAKTLGELAAEHGDRVSGTRLDVRDLAALSEHLEETRRTFGPIDILVWNSGGPPPGTADTIQDADLDDAYDLLLKPATHAIRNVLPSMRERGFGRSRTGSGQMLAQADAHKYRGSRQAVRASTPCRENSDARHTLIDLELAPVKRLVGPP